MKRIAIFALLSGLIVPSVETSMGQEKPAPAVRPGVTAQAASDDLDLPDAPEIAARKAAPKIYVLKHVNAQTLATHLKSVLPEYAVVTFDERTNSLLVKCNPELAAQMDVLVQALDGLSPADAVSKPFSFGAIHFVPLKHAKASNLASVLIELFQTKTAPGGMRPLGAAGQLVVTVDDAKNWLLIHCADDRLEAIKDVVAKLDQPARHQIGDPATTIPIRPKESRLDPSEIRSKVGLERLSIRPELVEYDHRAAYRQREVEARKAAQAYQKRREHLGPQHPDVAKLKADLHETVAAAFEARQQHQRAELAKLQQRFRRIQDLIEARERIKDKIIDRRVEELLNPDLRWDDVDIAEQATRNTNADDESRSEVETNRAKATDETYRRPTAEEQKATAMIPAVAWGDPVNGLRVAIVMQTPTVDENDDLRYEIVAENVSDKGFPSAPIANPGGSR